MGHMIKQAQAPLTCDASNVSYPSLSEQPLIWHKVTPMIAQDSAKKDSTKGVKTSTQRPSEGPGFTSME